MGDNEEEEHTGTISYVKQCGRQGRNCMTIYLGCFCGGARGLLWVFMLYYIDGIEHLSSIGSIQVKALMSMLLIGAFFLIICLVCIHYMVDKKTKRSIIAMMFIFAATVIIDTAIRGLAISYKAKINGNV